jgi:RNA polymerase sigma factor (sigma-70 family)
LRSGEAALRARSLETLIAAYWKPVYKYVRVRWGRPREEAEDLTQGFFLRAMEKGFFEDYDSEKSRVRTFLRTCVDAYVANEHRAGQRWKRGGGAVQLSMDFPGAEGELAEIPSAPSDSPEAFFQAEWVRGLFSLALESLRSECEAQGKAVHFRLFERYDLEDPAGDRLTYEALAAELGIPVTAVTNHLAFARREFRRILLEKLREITASDEEFRREARTLLGEGGD